MDTEQEPTKLTLSSPVQTPILNRTWRSSKKAAVPVVEKTPEYVASRFQGDGVRYKAKLIGVDDVPESQGDKMCVDSMMKLKGWEEASRRRGQHKQRVWLKVSSAGVRIIDERTGVVEHDHEIEKISSVKKDDSDPRAFSYIYGHNRVFKLFFIKIANAADPVIEDIRDVSHMLAEVKPVPETPPVQNGISLLLDEQVVTPEKPLSQDELTDLFGATTGNETSASLTTPSYHFSPPGVVQNTWASPQKPPVLPSQTPGITPYTLSSATTWGQEGHLRAPYPSFNSLWEATGPWTTQQAGSNWFQPNVLTQVGPGPQSPSVMTSPGVGWGQQQSVNPSIAVNLSPTGGEFSGLYNNTSSNSQKY